MPDLWADLLECLDLRSVADDSSFDGASQQLQYRRVLGGQLLAQVIQAPSLACPGKAVTSVHTVVAGEGRAADPVRYHATRQHQGRSFAGLTGTAQQPHAVLASCSVSMHTIEGGPESQDCQPISGVLERKVHVELGLTPWEIRCADDLNATTVSAPRLEIWMRTPPVDAKLAPALTAYATDLTLIVRILFSQSQNNG